MTIDLELILVLLALLTGSIWALDTLVFRPRREAAANGDIRQPTVVEYARSFFPVIIIVLVVRSFLFEPFRIPSTSMVPTLMVGDFIFVNKYTYGIRLPVLKSKVVELGSPQRGDVVVFRLPSDPGMNYIKRVVGLPGDTVSYRNKRLRVNGDLVQLELAGAYTGRGQAGAQLGHEVLGEAEHDVVHITGRPSREGEWTIPNGHYFLMGDNRENSRDSRFPEVDMVPENKLVGKAVRIWMSWDKSRFSVVWDRIGNAIK